MAEYNSIVQPQSGIGRAEKPPAGANVEAPPQPRSIPRTAPSNAIPRPYQPQVGAARGLSVRAHKESSKDVPNVYSPPQVERAAHRCGQRPILEQGSGRQQQQPTSSPERASPSTGSGRQEADTTSRTRVPRGVQPFGDDNGEDDDDDCDEWPPPRPPRRPTRRPPRPPDDTPPTTSSGSGTPVERPGRRLRRRDDDYAPRV